MAMITATSTVAEVCRSAKRAARELAQIDTATKDAALEAIATALQARAPEILAANERDMKAGREADLGDALLDRLFLDTERITLQALFEMIRRFKIGYDVELHKRTVERGLLSLIGPDAKRVAHAAEPVRAGCPSCEFWETIGSCVTGFRAGI